MPEVKIATPESLSHRGRLGFLLKDSALYGGAAAISKAFGLVTFPLLARHFSVTDYGVVDFFLVLAGFLAVIFIFGQDSAVARYFYEHIDTATRRQLISQSLVFQMAGLVLLIPLLWWSAGWLKQFLIKTQDTEWLFKIVLLQLPFLLLINFSQNLLKWTFARTKFLSMSMGFTVVQASLLVVAVLVFDIGIQGVLVVSLCTSSLFGILGLYFVRGWLTRPRDFRRLREMLSFAIPYGVICVLGAFLPPLERSLTDQLLGAEDLGLYAAGTKVAMLIGLVVSAFQTAWGPFSLSLYKQPDAAHTYNWVLKLFTLGMCVVVLGLALIAQTLIHLLASDRYAGAGVVVFPLSMGLAVQATSWITEIGIGIAKRSYLNLYAYGISVSATLGGILLLAPALGLLGVGMGVLIGHVARASTSSWLAQRAYPLAWHYASVAAVLGLTLAFGMAAIWAGHQWGQHAHMLTLGLGLVMVVIVGWSILLNRNERRSVLDMFHSQIQRLRAVPHHE
jgi:O-antigen/teichoic acid export membrane protein